MQSIEKLWITEFLSLLTQFIQIMVFSVVPHVVGLNFVHWNCSGVVTKCDICVHGTANIAAVAACSLVGID